MEKRTLELTLEESQILLGIINHAVSKGLPTIQDANNAVVLFGRLAQLFPPTPGESEGEIVEKDDDSKDSKAKG